MALHDGDIDGWRYGTGGMPRAATQGTKAVAAPPVATTQPPPVTTQPPAGTTPGGTGSTGGVERLERVLRRGARRVGGHRPRLA